MMQMHVKLDKELVLDLFLVSVMNQKLITKEFVFNPRNVVCCSLLYLVAC